DGEVDRAVGALPDIPDPAHSFEYHLNVRHAPTLDGQAGELLPGNPADEEAAPPLRERVARVDEQARRRDGRDPVVHGLLHPLAVRGDVDRVAVVVDAVADDGPAVVAAGPDEVELVATARPVLVRPDIARFRMDREALRVAVAVAPDLGQCALAVHERVVRGDAAVLVQADDGALVVREVLRRVLLGRLPGGRRAAVADAEEDVAAAVEGEARAEVEAAAAPRLRHEDLLHVHEAIALEQAARDRGRAIAPDLVR